MEETKNWYESKAVWGGVLAVAAGVLKYAGYDLGFMDQSALADTIVSGIAIVGGLLAIWGRVTASKKIVA